MASHGNPPSSAIPVVKAGHTTYHLTPLGVWAGQAQDSSYFPEAFDVDGFIHCTDSLSELVAVGNRYYREEPRPFVALQVDCAHVAAPIVYEDASEIFPHIYGPLEIHAVVAALSVRRSEDGIFLEITPFP